MWGETMRAAGRAGCDFSTLRIRFLTMTTTGTPAADSALIRFVRHPYTRLFVGVALALSGIAEIIAEFGQDAAAWDLGAHHGVAVFGIYKMLGATGDILDGLEVAAARAHPE